MPNWDAMGTVPLRSIFGSGEYHVDGVPYRVRFHNYNTFFGDTALTRGKWYYEVTVKDITGKCQFGWATERFLHRSAAVPPDEQVCIPLRSSSHGGEKVPGMGPPPPPSPLTSQGSWTWLPSFSTRYVLFALILSREASRLTDFFLLVCTAHRPPAR